jgi:threonine dehydrogenase-like Zn-dependent dehydrogenase
MARMMKVIVLLGNSKAELRELPVPEVKPGWALVRLGAAGICGSDLHFYHDSPESLGSRVGRAVGHEPSGTVEEIGAGVDSIAPGDRVSVYHWLSCGHCHYCRSGLFQFCGERMGVAAAGYGSCAEYVLAPARNCLPLPDALSFIDGAMMACCAATAYTALDKARAATAGDIVVMGMGPVGLSTLIEAKAMGRRIFAVEVRPYRIELASKLGADVVIDASQTDVVQTIRDLTHGRGADVIIETSGSRAGRSQLVEALAPLGTGIYVGLGAPGPIIDPDDLIHVEKTIMGSYVMPLRLYRPLAELLVDRRVNLERIVTHRFPIERGVEAFELFDQGETGKVILEFA